MGQQIGQILLKSRTAAFPVYGVLSQDSGQLWTYPLSLHPYPALTLYGTCYCCYYRALRFANKQPNECATSVPEQRGGCGERRGGQGQEQGQRLKGEFRWETAYG